MFLVGECTGLKSFSAIYSYCIYDSGCKICWVKLVLLCQHTKVSRAD